MKENPNAFQFVKLKPTKGHLVGVETFRNEEGVYDAGIYLFDSRYQEWFAIGNADDTSHFPSRHQAFQHGVDILRKASLY